MSSSILRLPVLPRSLCATCRYQRGYSSQALLAQSPSFHSPPMPNDSPMAGPRSKVSHPQAGIVAVTMESFKGEELRSKQPRRLKDHRHRTEDTEPRQNPLEPNAVDLHLASLQMAGLEPTLSDIDRCRPADHGEPESHQYAHEYRVLCDTLLRTFSKRQLRRFGEMYDLDSKWTRPSRRKIDYAEAIIEQAWKWPSLSEIEKQKMDRTQIEEKFFPVHPSQLFLILGRDGVDLLQMSMKYNVHISLIPSPLKLRVEGSVGSLRRVTRIIEELKANIVEDTIELSTKSPIRSDLVQRISRLAGAYIENLGTEGLIRIHAKAPQQLLAAKRLAIRSAFELQEHSRTPVLTYVPAEVLSSTPVPTSMFPRTYSVYPFLSPRSPPWTMNTSGAFRIRRVGEWLGSNASEELQKTGGLAEGNGHFLTSVDQPQSLKDALLSTFPGSTDDMNYSSRVITASFGHFLVTSSTSGQRATIIPPLKGFWALSKILKWLKTSNMKTSFVSSLPSPLLSSVPTRQKMLHRLVYHALPSTSNSAQPSHLSQVTNVLTFEIILAQPNTRKFSQDLGAIPELESASGHEDRADVHDGPKDSILPYCLQGRQFSLDVMMPDRPMDIRFSVFDFANVPSDQVPAALQEYTSGLRAFLSYQDPQVLQPDPPLTLTFGGTTYILNASMSVRQSIESVQTTGLQPVTNDPNDIVIHATCESMLDLESNQKSSTCQITCDDFASGNIWKRFLTSCDYLSTTTYRPIFGPTQKEGYERDDNRRLL